jgi:D-lactate dehydrogenase
MKLMTLDKCEQIFNLPRILAQNEKIEEGGKIVSVTEAESVSDMDALNAFRYVAALAFKTYCIGEDIQGISLDYALPMNGGLVPPLPASASR